MTGSLDDLISPIQILWTVELVPIMFPLVLSIRKRNKSSEIPTRIRIIVENALINILKKDYNAHFVNSNKKPTKTKYSNK